MFQKQVAGGSALILGAVAHVQAAVPTEVTAAMADMKSDGIAIATVVLVAVVALAAFAFMRRGIKG